MKRLLIGVALLTTAFTVDKCTFNAPQSALAADWGCTNVWVGNKLIKTGTCQFQTGEGPTTRERIVGGHTRTVKEN